MPTLIVAFVALCLAIGVPLASISGPRRGTGALWYWSLALLAAASGGTLLAAREVIPVIVSVMAGNALIICTIALLGEAAACFTEHNLDGTNRWFFVIATAPVLGLLYLTVDSIVPRFIYMAAVQAYLVAQLAWQLRAARLKSGERHHPAALTLEMLFWVLLAEKAVRTLVFTLLPIEQTFFGQISVSVAFLFGIVLIAAGTCVMIWYELSVKDATIHHVKTTDVDSGLPNRSTFIEHLSTHLAARKSGESVAFMRLRPVVTGGRRLDPFEEVTLYRNVGIRLEWGLERKDMLARFGEDEFIALLSEGDLQKQGEALRAILAELRGTPTLGEQARHVMEGRATLVACDAISMPADQLISIMRGALDRLEPGEVRVLTPTDYPGAQATRQ